MSNNSEPTNSKTVSLFVTFVILFIVVFRLGVIIGKGLGGPDTPVIDRSYEEEVFSEESTESEMTSEGPVVQDSELTETGSDGLILNEETETEPDDLILSEETETEPDGVDKQSAVDKTEVPEMADEADIDTPSGKPQSGELTGELTKEPVSDSKEEIEEKQSPGVSLEESPLEDQDRTPDESPLPTIDPGGQYTVQIGAFRTQSQANMVLNSMKSKGYPAFIKHVESADNKNWYRVRVGTFSTKGEAAEYGNLIKEKESGIKSVFITINN